MKWYAGKHSINSGNNVGWRWRSFDPLKKLKVFFFFNP